MGLREWWGRLMGDQDRLERAEEQTTQPGNVGPEPLEDYEGIKDDVTAREYEFQGSESAREDEEDIDGPK